MISKAIDKINSLSSGKLLKSESMSDEHLKLELMKMIQGEKTELEQIDSPRISPRNINSSLKKPKQKIIFTPSSSSAHVREHSSEKAKLIND